MALIPASLQKKLDEADKKMEGLSDEEIDAKLGPFTRWIFQKLEGREPSPNQKSDGVIAVEAFSKATTDALKHDAQDLRTTGWTLGSSMAMIAMGWGMGTMLHGVERFDAGWWTTTGAFFAATLALMAFGLRLGKPLPYLAAIIALLLASAQSAGDVHAAAAGLSFLLASILSILIAPTNHVPTSDTPTLVMPHSPLHPQAASMGQTLDTPANRTEAHSSLADAPGASVAAIDAPTPHPPHTESHTATGR